MKPKNLILFCTVLLLLISCSREHPIDFSSQVKPIINNRCITCHGGVKRNNGFSLLFRQDALDTTESGRPAIILGDPENSELVKRINHHDTEERMPYKEKKLPDDEIKILTQWIKEGAKWGDHWAYVAPKSVEVPSTGLLASLFPSQGFVRNNIDHFVLKKLNEKNLDPSEEAEREVILRRVYLDLIGIPPTPEQAKKFLNDNSNEAYEKMVDELLASQRFGEKWASWWLDMARYADTKGYEKDGGRVIWRYRDWVIKAFNTDMPFNQFTTEQLAGDLLPNPTPDQYIATGFHRNTMNNDEGGTDDEEFRVATVIDRVNTSYQVWQSTTFGCIQCHSHPYDPFRHEEYYQSLAFFNNTRDEDTEGEYPKFRFYENEDTAKVRRLLTWVNTHAPQRTSELDLFLKTLEPKMHAHVCDQYVNGALVDTKYVGLRHGGQARVPAVQMDSITFFLANFLAYKDGGWFELHADSPTGEIIASGKIQETKAQQTFMFPIKPLTGKRDLYWRFFNPKIPSDWPVYLLEWFSFQKTLPGKEEAGYEKIKSDFFSLVNKHVPQTPVMVENGAGQFRKTNVFERGNWMVKGKEVSPKTPKSLNPFPDGAPANRLGFAKWLMDESNPLTSRTIVNRLWEQLFGQGLVSTIEDFGTQGEAPSHPELLDYLALRFSKEYKWSIKNSVKEMVMSGTYRQSAKVENNWEKDPTNKWLARGPRFRLTAEQVRDQALQVSGLLSDKMYGPSVMPFQPANVWQSVYSGDQWIVSDGEDRFRRGVYTYVKRTSAYPSVMMFDGSSREVCQVQRVRTNTPLQALVTLNDPVFVEAARTFAETLNPTATPTAQIREAYKKALLHELPDEKLISLLELYVKSFENFKKDRQALQQIMNCDSDDAKKASLTIVCLAIFNLDEFLSKE
jgi:Protein of unknown function (DUF1553)/Protein of unknown function (DUF1549)/Planctomycete cytochrome C